MKTVQARTGVLLLNLGTPDSPSPHDVGVYLKEFLMDPLVIDIPWLARWILVHLLIVPRRKKASAKLYEKIWTPKGSPLRFYLEELAQGVRAQLGEDRPVFSAMRYGNPSIRTALQSVRDHHVPLDRLIVVPLYPQYSLSATESSIQEVTRVAQELGIPAQLDFFPAFYDRPELAQAYASIARPYLLARPVDHVIFSFHGLPERHVKKTDPTGSYCLSRPDCCEAGQATPVNCYRAQCYTTAQAIAGRLGLLAGSYTVAFQSRLGRTPWIQPFTDALYDEFPRRGIKKVAVFCPSFVADCLETLEEISIRGKEQFLSAGGTELYLIPSLNSDSSWMRSLSDWLKRH